METIRRKLILLFGGFVLLGLLAVASLWISHEKREGISIGAKGTEGEILAEILAQHIENTLEIPVYRKCQVEGTLILFEALKSKDIDLYVEYTGTALTAILGQEIKGANRDEIYRRVKKGLKKWDVEVLKPLGFENKYALIMEKERAKELGIKTFSDLGGKDLNICLDQEFCSRVEFSLLKDKYQVPMHTLKMMDHMLVYLTLEKKGCDLINGYSTDGFCRGLLLLEDDLSLFPSYEAVPIVRKEILEKYEGLHEILSGLKGAITEEMMQEMNYKLEKKGESVYDIAKAFIHQRL